MQFTLLHQHICCPRCRSRRRLRWRLLRALTGTRRPPQ
uniref:Uncharacterized protein n=1 Tax=Rhizophora mucronata TaxID=61149 RepID=A0A2P2IIU5_RHIMU